MRAVLEHLSANDEVGLVATGQSNRRPNGDRDSEGYVEAPHLKLRASGLDLTIHAIVSATGGAHGAAGTQSVVSVGEQLAFNEWINGELRLVQHEFGDSVASSLRRGHGKVLSCAGAAANVSVGGTLIFDVATDFIYWPGHGRPNGSQILFTTTGVLPGLTPGGVYYIRDRDGDRFKVSATPFGAAVNLAGGTGTHTAIARPFLVVQWLSEFMAPQGGVTFIIGGAVQQVGHNLPVGTILTYDINLPAELTAGVQYVINSVNGDFYTLSTLGGALISFAAGAGPATATPVSMGFCSGYVHLHDRFNSYDNVQVVTPYQPIEPGDYPAGAPVVPGVTLQPDVTSYADAALVLPLAWNEGIDGHGAAGTATRAGNVVTFEGGLTVPDKLFAGGFIRKGGAKGKVASNTTTTVTVESWTPTAGPANTSEPFELHLPHWRNNPHHHTAGEGFLYPNGDMQPGAVSSHGQTYSRPRARLSASYIGRALDSAPVSSAIAPAATGLARLTTNGAAQLVVSIVGGQIKIERATNSRDPATGLIQFEDFLRPGYIVGCIGTGQTPSIDTFWRVVQLVPSTPLAGSYVLLDIVEGVLGAVPGAVAGVVPSGAFLTRMFWKPKYKFGSLLETAFRMAVSIGRRIVVTLLGINSAGLIAAIGNNPVSFQGKIGWWDDDDGLDWTPSNPDGLASRLKRLIEFIAPRAVKASLGSSKTLKQVAIDIFGAETDTVTKAGRELAQRSIPTFLSWLRSVITTAGQSPYPTEAKVPFQWAKICTSPWELLDTGGLVNKALARTIAFDGFGSSIDPNLEPKVDPLHFNGVGEVHNGAAVAALLLQLIEFGFQFRLGPGAVSVCNRALNIIGDASDITSLEPPNSTNAKNCLQHLAKDRDVVLQRHPWTFATRRTSLVAVDNEVSSWQYAYAVPADLLHPTAVLAPDSPDDLQIRRLLTDPNVRVLSKTVLAKASQPHTMETDRDGNRILRTNQVNAVVIYTARNVDFALWDPLALQALEHRLASKLAGGTLKGKTGIATAQQLLQIAEGFLMQAAALNAEFQRDVQPEPGCPWLP